MTQPKRVELGTACMTTHFRTPLYTLLLIFACSQACIANDLVGERLDGDSVSTASPNPVTAPIGTEGVDANSGTQAADANSGAAAVDANAPAPVKDANTTAVDMCTGNVTIPHVDATDVNPPTWTWSKCNIPAPKFRISLDSATGPVTETSATSFTPSTGLKVGTHTLYVAQLQSDGTWSATTSSTLKVVVKGDLWNGTHGWVYPADANGITALAANLEAGDANWNITDVIQLDAPESWLLAPLAAVVAANPNYARSLVHPVVDGSSAPVLDANRYPLYSVALRYVNAQNQAQRWTFVTDSLIPDRQGLLFTPPSSDGRELDITTPVLEKAIVALNAETGLFVTAQHLANVGFEYGGTGNGYDAIWGAGVPPIGFAALTGSIGAPVAQYNQATLTSLLSSHKVAITSTSCEGTQGTGTSTLPSGATLSFDSGSYIYMPKGSNTASWQLPCMNVALVSIGINGVVHFYSSYSGRGSLPFEDFIVFFGRNYQVSLP